MFLYHHLEQSRGEPKRGDASFAHRSRDLVEPGALRGNHQLASVEQRAPDFERGSIEGKRSGLKEDIVWRDFDEIIAAHESRHGTLRNQHALRLAGRTGGEEQIGRMFRCQRDFGEFHGGRAADLRNFDQAAIPFTESNPLAGRRQADLGAGFLQQQGEALCRIVGVERDIGTAREQDTEEAGDHFRRRLRAQCDQVAGFYSRPDETRGKGGGFGVELRVSQRNISEFQRGPRRMSARRFSEEGSHRRLARIGGRLAGPLVENGLRLAIGQDL